MAEDLVDPGDQAQVEPSTLCPTLLVAGALTGSNYYLLQLVRSSGNNQILDKELSINFSVPESTQPRLPQFQDIQHRML